MPVLEYLLRPFHAETRTGSPVDGKPPTGLPEVAAAGQPPRRAAAEAIAEAK